MITEQIVYLSAWAAAIGISHTVLGPDHYIPFVFLARARNWSQQKTIIITILCGLGHVGSSIALGFAAIALGYGIKELTHIETIRGNWAAWAFVIFGLLYMFWGLYKAYKNKPHKHFHIHNGGVVHDHIHHHNEEVHRIEHAHIHTQKSQNLTPWVLFVIFVLGPCEPLIFYIIYPAAQERGNIAEAIIVSIVFAIATLITMVIMVLILQKGLNSLRLNKLERFTHAIAGAMLFLSGIGILFLGL